MPKHVYKGDVGWLPLASPDQQSLIIGGASILHLVGNGYRFLMRNKTTAALVHAAAQAQVGIEDRLESTIGVDRLPGPKRSIVGNPRLNLNDVKAIFNGQA